LHHTFYKYLPFSEDMKKLPLMLAIILLVPVSMADTFPSGSTQDELYGLAIDDAGNIITVGQHYDGEKYVIRVQKYDGNTGKITWQTDFDEYATNVGKAVVVDGDYIYVGGVVGKEIAGIPIPQTDYIIIKYDSNGNEIASKTYDNGFADFLMDMGVDENGNIYATGMTLYIDISSQQLTNVDFWTIKVNPNNLQKVKEDIFDSAIDAAFGIDVRGNNIVVAGAVQEENSNISKFLTVKYDTDLDVVWQREYYNNKISSASDAVILPDGSIAVTGYELTDDMKVEDFLTLVYSSTGTIKSGWPRVEMNDYKDDALSIDADSNDNIVVGGYRTIKVNNAFHERWYLIKYNRNGGVIWDKMDDVEGEIKRIVVDSQNNIIAAGYKMVGGEEKYCIRKYTPDGDKIWEAQYGNPPAPLKADFTWTPSQPTRGQYVHFNDLSTGDIQSWEWNFGDGTTSNQQNPVHSYSTLGTFQVTLTITSSTGEDTITKNITVINALPVASFFYNPLNPVENETINFDASTSSDSDGSIVSYEWDFGDGSTATGMTVSHSYGATGKYKVTLTVTDSDGAQKSIYKYVTVSEAGSNTPPVPSFTYSPSNPSPGDSVSFDASASYDEDGTIQLYIWDWGDGSQLEEKTLPTVIHSWNTDGEYTVTLTVRDNNGSESSYSSIINVGGSGENKQIIISFGNLDVISIEKGKERNVGVDVSAINFTATNVRIIVTENGNLTVTPQNIISRLKSDETDKIYLKIKTPENMSEGTVKIKLKAVCDEGVESDEEYINVVIHKGGESPSFTFVMLLAAAMAMVAFRYIRRRK